jgi:hypothetical protein
VLGEGTTIGAYRVLHKLGDVLVARTMQTAAVAVLGGGPTVGPRRPTGPVMTVTCSPGMRRANRGVFGYGQDQCKYGGSVDCLQQ